MRPVLFGLLQLGGALAAAAGVYLLLGLAWALVIVGTAVLVGFTAAETISARPVAPRTPASALPTPSTELPGAPRSRPRTQED